MLADKLRAASYSTATPEFVSASIAAVSSGLVTVTAPTGIQDGDLLVAISASRTTDNIIAPPSGFSQIHSTFTNDSAHDVTINVKTASSESGNYTFIQTASDQLTVAILVYRNATRVNTVGTISSSNITNEGVAESITPTYKGVLLAAFAHSTGGTTIVTPPSGMTQRAFENDILPLAVYELDPQPASATGNKTLVWNNLNPICSLLLQISNEPSIAPTFVASAKTQNPSTGGTLTIDKPAGTQEGDLMVALMGASGNFSGGWTDSTFTEVRDFGESTGIYGALRICYKVAGGSEPSSYSFTAGETGKTLSGIILTYRYAEYSSVGTGTTLGTIQGVNNSESQCLLISFHVKNTALQTLPEPTTMTMRDRNDDSTNPSWLVCEQVVPKGLTGTRQYNGASGYGSCLLAIAPTRSL